jgi:hypothetical protein
MALSPLGLALMMQAPGAQARPGVVAPTDTLGAYNLTANMAEQQYQAKLQQQNALWGGLAGIGSAGIIGASKIPAIQNAVGNWLTGGGAAPAAAPGTIGAAATDYAANPILGDADFSSLLSAGAPSLWGAGTGAAADAGAGSVAADLAADTGTAAAGAGADAAGMGLADLLPFLFA